MSILKGCYPTPAGKFFTKKRDRVLTHGKWIFSLRIKLINCYICIKRIMPTILKRKGYRFFFYINDHTPPHIHVEKERSTAKFLLKNVELVRSKRFNANETSMTNFLTHTINIKIMRVPSYTF